MDHRDEFQNWCNLWDQALEDEVFPTTPSEAPAPIEKDVDTDPYYDYLDSELEAQVLHESKKRTPNPIYPDSVGKDQESAKPWPESKCFQKVLELKLKLYDIECKLSETYGGGKKWNQKSVQQEAKLDRKLLSQIDSLRKQIDQLSDNLGIEDEPSRSTWTVEG